jgi:tetratricopeptide (TPR) repeat protein
MAWLDSADVIASDHETRAAVCSGEPVVLAFPRDWPAAFTETAALRRLVNKSLRGTRCRAVDLAEESAREEGLDTTDSFACSAQLAGASGLAVIQGFVVYECIRPGECTPGFVAFRHRWNASPGGAWIDRAQPLVPTSSGCGRVLLVESALGEDEAVGAERSPARACDAAVRAHLARVASNEQPRASPLTDVPPGWTAGDVHHRISSARPAEALHVRAATEALEGTAQHHEGGNIVPSLSSPTCTSDPSLSSQPLGAAGKSGDNGPVGGDSIPANTVSAVAPPADGSCGTAGGDTAPANPDLAGARPESCLERAAALRAEGLALFARGHVGGAKGRFERAADARIAAAEAAKEEGNNAFRRGEGGSATAHYERALAALGCGPKPGHLKRVPPQPYDYYYECGVADAEGDPSTVEFARVLRLRTPTKLIIALHSNVAASCLLEQRYETAREAATAALRLDPSHTKSRSRRAAAFEALGKHSSACADLALALAASMGTPAVSELASQLIQQWRLRAPCICKYVDESCARAAKAGAHGAVEMALARALHGIGSAADWARNTPIPGCGLTPDGEWREQDLTSHIACF